MHEAHAGAVAGMRTCTCRPPSACCTRRCQRAPCPSGAGCGTESSTSQMSQVIMSMHMMTGQCRRLTLFPCQLMGATPSRGTADV